MLNSNVIFIASYIYYVIRINLCSWSLTSKLPTSLLRSLSRGKEDLITVRISLLIILPHWRWLCYEERGLFGVYRVAVRCPSHLDRRRKQGGSFSPSILALPVCCTRLTASPRCHGDRLVKKAPSLLLLLASSSSSIRLRTNAAFVTSSFFFEQPVGLHAFFSLCSCGVQLWNVDCD
jgi:hypothetical protein